MCNLPVFLRSKYTHSSVCPFPIRPSHSSDLRLRSDKTLCGGNMCSVHHLVSNLLQRPLLLVRSRCGRGLAPLHGFQHRQQQCSGLCKPVSQVGCHVGGGPCSSKGRLVGGGAVGAGKEHVNGTDAKAGNGGSTINKAATTGKVPWVYTESVKM